MNNFNLRTILAVLLATLSVTVTARAQEYRLNLPDTRMSVSSIFHEIRRQTTLGVAYRTDQIDPGRMVSLPAGDVSLDQVIDIIVDGTDLKGVIDEGVIVFIRNITLPAHQAQVADNGFVPMPMSEFRESLGLRPRSVMLESELESMMLQDTFVEIDMPMDTYKVPTGQYTAHIDKLPRFAIKTNLLYGIGTLTPNLSFEIGLSNKTSLEIGGSYNPWNVKGSVDNNRKLVHMIIKPEFRYWLCGRFDGHFFGAHLLYGRYLIDSHEVPLLFRKSYKYDGHMVGAGITYGYSLAFHKRWSVEFAIGGGFMYLNYDRFDCGLCNGEASGVEHLQKWYLGVTNAAVSLVFHIK